MCSVLKPNFFNLSNGVSLAASPTFSGAGRDWFGVVSASSKSLPARGISIFTSLEAGGALRGSLLASGILSGLLAVKSLGSGKTPSV